MPFLEEDKDFDRDDYIEVFFDQGLDADGKELFAIPAYGTTQVLYYIIRLRLKRQVLIRHPSKHGRIWKRQPKRCRKGKRSMDGSRCGVMQI